MKNFVIVLILDVFDNRINIPYIASRFLPLLYLYILVGTYIYLRLNYEEEKESEVFALRRIVQLLQKYFYWFDFELCSSSDERFRD